MTAHLWQSTVFACAVALLALAFRNNRAQVRFSLWFAASLKFLVPFAPLIALGERLQWRHAITPANLVFVAERIAEPFPSALPMPQPHTDWRPLALTAIWACGFLAIAALRLRGGLRIRRAMRQSTPLGMASGIEIRASANRLEPGAVGIVRPIILLPYGIAESLTPAQLESVIAHELCHIRRRDNLAAAIHMAVEALFWFHPLVWWIGAKLIEERETACDESVLALGNQPRIYADAIVGVCKLYLESPVACVSGVTGADLKRRIEAIMTNRIGLSLNRAKKFLLAGAAITAIAVPVAIGFALSVGRLPIIHAQTPAPTAQPAPPKQNLIAMMFDFASMTADEQTSARQSAIQYVNASLTSGDVVAIFSAQNGKVRVDLDFTANRAALAAAIQQLPVGSAGLPGIESAAKILAALPDKKRLMYYSAALPQPGDPSLQSVIDAAKRANLAIFPIDVKIQQKAGVSPYVIGPLDVLEIRIAGAPDLSRVYDVLANGNISMPLVVGPIRADGLTKDELARAIREKVHADVRVEVLRVNSKLAGPENATMWRLSRKYGLPDTVDAGAERQIWRYNFLRAFNSKAEFELTPANDPKHIRINWPPPLATYKSAHASIQTYPSSAWQVLSIATESLSGHVQVYGQIQLRGSVETKAVFRDDVAAPEGRQFQFVFPAGSYVCALTAHEAYTKRSFSETIEFEVK